MNRFFRLTAFTLSLALTGCTNTDKLTFFNYGVRPNPGAAAPEDPMVAPAVSDGLAVNYANSMQIVMRSNATGSRITREVSNTVQVALAAFGGVGAAFNYSATTLAVLGLGSAGVPELQKIFNAKGRGEAYSQAADMIQDAVLDYYSHNPAPSSTAFTPNGLTLVKNVSAAVGLVENVLSGQLPSQHQMLQAVEGMSPEGTRPQNPRLDPVNSHTVRVKATLPAASQPQVYVSTDIKGNTTTVPVDVQEDQRRISTWISDRQLAEDYGPVQLFVQRAGVKETLLGSAAATRARHLVRDATTRDRIDALLPLIKPGPAIEKPLFPLPSEPGPVSLPSATPSPSTGPGRKPAFPGASTPQPR